MRLVTAVIRPHRLDPVRRALIDAGLGRLTVTAVRGYGRQAGHTETYRGAEYRIDVVPKVHVEVVCDDGDVDRVVEAVRGAAFTGSIGDGKVWVTPVEHMVRIRTAEAGPDAV